MRATRRKTSKRDGGSSEAGRGEDSPFFGAIELLQHAVNLGCSSRYRLTRHAAERAADYERALGAMPAARDAASWAVRGRLERLLGRRGRARLSLRRAVRLEPGLACARAWLWELDAQRPGPALAGLDRAVALEPLNPEWRCWRGVARLTSPSKGSARAALADFRFVLCREPGRVLARAGAAEACRLLGRLPEAVAHLGAALAREPREAWLYRLRSRARRRLGDRKGFVADCERLILLEESVGDFADALGGMDGYDPRVVRAGMDRLIARGERSHWIYALRADCLRSPEICEPGAGLEDLKTAVALNPRCAWTRAYLARALAPSDPRSATREIAAAARLAPDSGWIRIWRGELRRRTGDAAGALSDFNAGLRLCPDYDLGYAWRGAALRACGRAEEALIDLDFAVRLCPSEAWIRAERGAALRALGRVSLALEDIEAAYLANTRFTWARGARRELDAELRRDPTAARAWAWRGDLRRREGSPREALADFDRALSLRPRYALARAWRGLALRALGRRREALKDASEAVALAPRTAPYRAWRGKLREDLGDLRGAAADYRRAVALDPTAAWALAWKGELELKAGRLSSARRDLARALSLDPANEEARRSFARIPESAPA